MGEHRYLWGAHAADLTCQPPTLLCPISGDLGVVEAREVGNSRISRIRGVQWRRVDQDGCNEASRGAFEAAHTTRLPP